MATPLPTKISKNQRSRAQVEPKKKSLCPKGHEIHRALYAPPKGGRKFIWYCDCDCI